MKTARQCDSSVGAVILLTPSRLTLGILLLLLRAEGKVVLGDTKEGSMAIRLAPTMRVEGKVGKGHIINSEGHKDESAWGKRAAWCDYYGPVEGETVGWLFSIIRRIPNIRHGGMFVITDYSRQIRSEFPTSSASQEAPAILQLPPARV